VTSGDGEMDEPAPFSRSLAELAAEGRERQAAALAAEADEARRMELRERHEVERLGRGNVRASLLDSPRGAAPPLLALACVAVAAGTLLLLAGPDRWSPVGLGLIALAIGGFFGGRWIVGMRLVRVERRWLLSLPFPVRGYFRVLGATPAEERTVRVRIRFRGAAPDREMLDGLLGRVQYPASARLTRGSGTVWTAESGPIRTVFVDDGHPSNATTLDWMRGVIEEALLPLHAEYPLASVEFGE
jgi:hypothetical protein